MPKPYKPDPYVIIDDKILRLILFNSTSSDLCCYLFVIDYILLADSLC